MPVLPPTQDDPHWMSHALKQARRGVGLTSPNPAVGSVIVADGQIIGEGYHHKAGMPHAEIEAIRDAKKRHPKKLNGATIYVTLEPCCTQGRTGPCTEAIIAEGIKRVVWGAEDPNPKHLGRAVDVLTGSGLSVTTGVLAEECREVIRPFAKWITTGLPYVIAKAGQSLDGRLTRPPGEGQWITNEEARKHGRSLRGLVDAILVGAETVRQDNPQLTLRDGTAPEGKEQPLRVVLTRNGSLPQDAHLFTDAFKERTVVLHGLSFREALEELGKRGVVSVLIEGGGQILEQVFANRLVDEVYWYVAPILCGNGVSVLGDAKWAASVKLEQVKILPMGDNVCVHGCPAWPN